MLECQVLPLLRVLLLSANILLLQIATLFEFFAPQPALHAGYDPVVRAVVRGQWKYLYRAVDKAGNTVDFLLRARRDKLAARRYFERAIARYTMPTTVAIDKSGANRAALEAVNAERETPIQIRQNKYLNNVVEHDHRAIKRIRQADDGLQGLPVCPHHPIGSEVMHMICKGQIKGDDARRSVAERFFSLIT
jgi:transposase-like protein